MTKIVVVDLTSPPMANPDNLKTVYVSQLPWSVRDKCLDLPHPALVRVTFLILFCRNLQEYFADLGEITDCFIVYRGIVPFIHYG